MLCVIIPTLNSAANLPTSLANIKPIADDVIVSDGVSNDDTVLIAIQNGARIALGSAGRGRQLARAAKFSDADWMLFLHGDTRLGAEFKTVIDTHMKDHADQAGYFKLRFDAQGFAPHCLEFLVSLRCWLFALPYGDQGLLISKTLYEKSGGFPQIDLFEDVEIARALGRKRLRRLKCTAFTDASKFEQDGYFKRGFRNFRLLRRYLKGEDIAVLKRDYFQ